MTEENLAAFMFRLLKIIPFLHPSTNKFARNILKTILQFVLFRVMLAAEELQNFKISSLAKMSLDPKVSRNQ